MHEDKPIAVKVNDVAKDFMLNHEKTSSIKSSIVNVFKNKKNITEKHQVLKGVSFDIKQGEFFGIVGRNGSGKSTLLKIIAEIYRPTSGNVEVNGRLVPFIELGVGFNPELTGRENVYLNGALLGFSKAEIDGMYDEIVAFAELEKFMDQKLKNYSSGMQVRLAFSVAIKAKGDILVLDEVLAVGDEAFQRKCERFFDQIKKDQTKTVILVTHTMENVQKYCDRAMMISEGDIVVIGNPSDVANEYVLENSNVQDAGVPDKNENEESVVRSIRVEMLSPNIVDEATKIKIKINYHSTLDSSVVLNLFDKNRQVPLFASSSQIFRGSSEVSHLFEIGLKELNDTNIQVQMSIRDEHNKIIAFPSESELPSFILRRQDYIESENRATYAVMFDRGEWR